MVPGSGSRMEGGGGSGSGTHIYSARVRKTIQSIKEIVGNHSDADIYVALKETNMDPNETTQKLLYQDPFHEVKRRRDRRKEPQNVGNKGSADLRRDSETVGQGRKFHTPPERNVRRANYSRNTLPGISKEFRVVRDNRVNHIYKEVKPPSLQCTTSTNEQLVVNSSEKGSSEASSNKKSSAARNSSQALNGPVSQARYSRDAVSNVRDRRVVSEEKQGVVLNAVEQMKPTKPSIHQNAATVASTSSAVGVYSSSTDPVHVPSPESRSSGVVGAIRREVGVVGVRRQSLDNSFKQSSGPSSSFAGSPLGKDGTSADSIQSAGAISKTEHLNQSNATEPSFPGAPVSRPSLNNQHNSRSHQQNVGHQRVSQHNKEWKPKSSQKLSNNSPGVIGTPKKAASPPAVNSKGSNTAEVQAKLSQVNLYENQNVIIAEHIRVPETDRCQLTFGTIGTEIDSSRHQSKYQLIGANEKSNEESTKSLTVPAPELSTDDVSRSKQVDIQNDHIRSTESESLASGAAAEQQLPDNKDSSSPQHLENSANIGLVRENSPAYVPSESHQQQASHDIPGFSAYDAPTGYDMPYFRPSVDETVRVQSLSSSQEVLNSHVGNSIPASTIAMMQQQQAPVAQMYPQVHVSHFANLMPYRQFLSPVYVPPMAMPGYSNNPPYPPHPSNGSSYLLMPGGSSHLNANNSLKYGVQQFKPVTAGNPSGFGNFANPGYAMLSPGVVGGATALEDSSRLKYKDNLYVPNPQAETSEIWIQNPRELPGMQSTPYYNLQGQTPHAAYMPSHTGHAQFNAAAAAQSSHMQFPGMYHAPPQPAAMASPHHLGPAAMGNSVGVGVAGAAPGPQVGAYQQPQLGQFNWTTNF